LTDKKLSLTQGTSWCFRKYICRSSANSACQSSGFCKWKGTSFM